MSVNICLITDYAGSVWSSGLYSDLTVLSGNETFKVHQCIICPRSTFFTAACRGGFKACSILIMTYIILTLVRLGSDFWGDPP